MDPKSEVPCRFEEGAGRGDSHPAPTEDVCQALWQRPIRGSTTAGPGKARVALEMEILAFHKESLLPCGLDPSGPGPLTLLGRIANLVPGAKAKVDPKENVITGVELPGGANFSLEPGGQVEYASAPAARFEDLAADVKDGLALLERAAAGELVFLGSGTNPLTGPDHPLLLPKERYLVMTRYFNAVPGGRGVHMMRHTGTVQPNLDVPGDDSYWRDAVDLTWVLTPFARHLFANSPWFQGNRSASYSERQSIWPAVDPTRTLIPEGVPFAEDIPCAYARWARRASVFHVPGLPLEEQPLPGELPFEAWLEHGYKGTRPTLKEWEAHLGTLFPDLRLRGFLEIRMVDAQPFEHMMAPVAFFAGLLQHRASRARVWEFLLGVARSYVDCSRFSGSGAAVGDLPDEAVFSKLVAEDPTHPVFADTRLHRQLVRIAQDALAAAGEPVGVDALEAYLGFMASRHAHFDAPDARSFVASRSTTRPAAAFVSHLERRSRARGGRHD